MSEPTTIDPKVISRIQKMLNLARCGGATEAEAETAMAHAEATMRKYNLTMAEVEATGQRGGEGSKRTKQEQKGRAQYEFQQNLMQACAEVNYCIVLTTSVWKNGRYQTTGFVLIGREANVIATRELYDYLATTTERLAFDFVGQDNRQRLSRSAISFKTGCAERLGERLRTRHQASLEEQAREARERNAASQHPGASTGTALAIVLKDFAQEEEDRNTDIRWNLPEGTTAAQNDKARRAGEVHRAARRLLKGATSLDREYLLSLVSSADALGLSEHEFHGQLQAVVDAHLETLEAKAAREAETPAQRRKREEQEVRENERFWKRHRREQDARAARTDFDAKDAGQRAANHVGLDKQVKDAAPPSGLLK